MFGGAAPGGSPCGAFRLDRRQRLLFDAEGRVVPLRPRAAGVLDILLQQPGRVVSRRVLLDQVWQNLAVTDDSLTQCVVEIRRAIAGSGVTLRTVPRRGYRLDIGEGTVLPTIAVRHFPQHGGGVLGDALAQEVAVELVRDGVPVVLGGHACFYLLGSVRPVGSSHRLVVQLVEAPSSAVCWGGVFDLAEELSAGIARRIAEEVRRRIAPPGAALGGYAQA
jgi:hypothetical protein